MRRKMRNPGQEKHSRHKSLMTDNMDQDISPEFPYESKFVEIDGSKMHYIDVGEGDPVLFLHGNPTSSYLWRNVIPHVQPHARCIAPDLIGMGKSDKPDIGYTFEEHYAYLEKFIEAMDLMNVTLVIHDWGSGLGFHYANMHRDNIKGIAFMEAMYKPMTWDGFIPKYKFMFKMLRAPFIGWLLISVANMFVNKMLPDNIVRKLTKEELDTYKEPYPTVKSRKPVRVWPQEIPLDGKPKRVHDKAAAWHEWLMKTDLPKMCFYAATGGLVKEEDVVFIRENMLNIRMVDLGEGKHFLQEDHPHRIGEEVAEWYRNI